MPPPQQLLSSAVSIVPKKWLNPTFLVLLVFLVVALPLSSPSESTSVRTSRKSTKWAHWSVRSEEICPSAKGWVTHPGSFCETLWNSPYLSNRTELEARERRAIQFYCEMDSILDRFDCAQEYSVNVRRGQCKLCREAYREWACAMITDTLEDGQLDCETKLMPCPSCASICHQVMRLCPYLSPDRNQADRKGQITPQTSQYGGHPAFYCPLENDDPSDPAYTSLCFHQSPFSTPDPDYIHNICTNPPIHLHQDPPDLNHPLRYNNKPKDYYFYSRGKGGRTARTAKAASDHFYSPRSSSSPSSVNYFNDRAEYNSGETFNSYSVGGGVGGGAADENGAFTHSSGSSDAYGDEEDEPPEEDDWVSAMPHYTSCCWTYASSVVNFLPAQDFPEYGSDTYFVDAGTSSSSSTAATTFTTFTTTTTNTTPLSSAHSPRSRDSPTLRNNKDSFVNNGSVVDEGGRGGGSTPTTSPTKPSSVSDNRVILNCCDSRGVCNSRDPFDVSQEEDEDELTTEQAKGAEGEAVKKTRRSGKSEEVVALGPSQESKQSPSSHKRSGAQTDDSSTSASFYFPGEESSRGSAGGGGGAGVQAFDLKGGGGGGGVGPEEEFFRSEDGVSALKPTHRPGGDGGVDYDEHYVDTEPDGDGGSSSTELEDDEIFEPPGYSAAGSSGTSESEWGEKTRRTSGGDGGKLQGEGLVNSKDKLKTSYLSSSSSSFSDSSFFSSSSYPGRMFSGKSGESESKRSFVEIVMGSGGTRGDVDRDHGQMSSGSDDDSRTAPDLHFVSFDNEEMVVVGDGGRRRATTSEESSGGGGVVVGGGDGQGGIRRPTWSDPWPGSLTVPSSSSYSSVSSTSGSSACSWSPRPRRQSPPRTYLAKVLYRISTDCCHLFVMLLIALLCLTLTNFLPVFLLNLEDGVGGGSVGGDEIPLDKSSNFVTTESGSSEGVSSTCSSNSNRHSRRNEHFERVKKAVVLEDSATCKSDDDSSRKYYDDIRSREVWAPMVSRRISRKKMNGDEAYFDNWGHIYSSRDLREKCSDECNYYYEHVRRRGVFLMFMNAVLINMMSYLKSSRGASLARLDLKIKLGYYHYYYCYCYFYLSLRNYENDDRGDSSSKLLADLYCCKVFKLLIHLIVCERLSESAGQTSVELMWGTSQHNYCYYQAVITIRYYSCTTTSVLSCSGCYFYVIPLTWLSNNDYVARSSSRRDEEVLTIEDLNNKGMSPLSLVGTSNHNTLKFTGKVGGKSCKPFVFDVCPVKILCIVSFITKPLPTLPSRTSGRQKTSHDRVSQCFPNTADISYCKRRFRKMQAITRGDGYFQSFDGTFPSEVVIHCGRVGAVGNFDLDNRTPSEETWERPFLRRGERVSIGRCDDFCTVLEKVCSCRGGDDEELTDERFPDYVIPWKLQTVCRESGHLVCKSKQSEHFHGQSIYGQDEEDDDDEVKDGGVFTSLNKVTIPHYSSICSRSKGEEGEKRMCRLCNPLLLSIDNNYYRLIKYYLKTCRWFCSKGHEGCWVGIVFVNVILFYDARCSLPGSGSLTRISQWTVSETSTTKSSCNNYDNLLSVNDKRIIIGFLLMNLLILRRCFTLFFYCGGFASFPLNSHSYKRLHLYATAQLLCNIISTHSRLHST